nr:unnamed protein product [Callosobruchus analis]
MTYLWLLKTHAIPLWKSVFAPISLKGETVYLLIQKIILHIIFVRLILCLYTKPC